MLGLTSYLGGQPGTAADHDIVLKASNLDIYRPRAAMATKTSSVARSLKLSKRRPRLVIGCVTTRKERAPRTCIRLSVGVNLDFWPITVVLYWTTLNKQIKNIIIDQMMSLRQPRHTASSAQNLCRNRVKCFANPTWHKRSFSSKLSLLCENIGTLSSRRLSWTLSSRLLSRRDTRHLNGKLGRLDEIR